MPGEDEDLTPTELHIWQLASEAEQARNVTVRSRRAWVREKVLNMAHVIEGRGWSAERMAELREIRREKGMPGRKKPDLPRIRATQTNGIR